VKKLKVLKPAKPKKQHTAVKHVSAHAVAPAHKIALHHSLSSGNHPKVGKPVQPKKSHHKN
jgi:hypothetical protein